MLKDFACSQIHKHLKSGNNIQQNGNQFLLTRINKAADILEYYALEGALTLNQAYSEDAIF